MTSSVTVMTYNVGNGRAQPRRLVKVLGASGAEIIALQEVAQAQARAIETELAQEYPYQALAPNGFAGKALLSRYPIHQAELLKLGPERPTQRAIIDINGHPVTLVNAHPLPPHLAYFDLRFDTLTWQEIQVLARLALAADPCLLLGDFNLIDRRREYAYLQSTGLHDAFARSGTGQGYTLPRRVGPWKRFLIINHMLRWIPLAPVLRVDYIWYTPSLQAVAAWIGSDGGSDHLPVLAQIALPPV